MNISNIALLTFIALSTTTTAFLTSPSQVSSFMMAQRQLPPHRIIPFSMNMDDKQELEEVHINLELLTVRQLQETYNELETINEACTEDCKQTNDECDVALKDERDVLMVQIQSILQERSVEDALSKVVDMDLVNSILQTPWTHPLNEIKNTIKAMESLNCQCTEEGNQTNAACDIELKDERDAAIETLTMYMKSVQNLVADAAAASASVATHEEEETTRKRNLLEKQQEEKNRSAHHVVEKKKRKIAYSFDVDEIRDFCLNNPGSMSLETMKTILTQLEADTNACTEDGTQTNVECEIDIKAERYALMDALVHQIQDATICLNAIQAFTTQNNIHQLAMDDVMNTVRNTISTTKKKVSTTTTNENHHPIATTITTPTFTAPTDEFVIQI